MTSDLHAGSTPRLAPGVRLREDAARGGWVLLGPERVLQPDPIAVEILKRVDGQRTLEAIVEGLAQDFTADPAQIEKDVRLFLTGLAEKGLLDWHHDPSR
ncbi:MAG TPA: pyrroloquinoline quinone biosynthesis peptide chaperone PqqD [Kiloniellales bacterium]|nr:pyrroloquinoline quinone biosynthesis peptide chaperone PqqD [Kiloniellales bacterium]